MMVYKAYWYVLNTNFLKVALTWNRLLDGTEICLPHRGIVKKIGRDYWIIELISCYGFTKRTGAKVGVGVGELT